ncbi:MAG: hypothetical protein IKE48_01740 [Parasporobacterium sp.]|nr:hypothetical protein [Parasporobacterium sp.]
MRTFREDVERAVSYHGHLCSGQCIGVKMARLGLKTLGLDPDVNPKTFMSLWNVTVVLLTRLES